MQKIIIRYLGYALIVMVITTALLSLAYWSPGSMRFDHYVPDLNVVTSEFSPVEVLQNILLLWSAAAFGWIALRDRLRRPLAIVFVALFATFLVRELDFFLDFYLIDNLWQVLGAIILSVALVYVGRDRERLEQAWRRSWPSAGLAMIFGGLILLIPYAQIIGHEPLWQSVMGDNFVRVVKVIVEEFVELGAYGIIAIGSAEFLYAWSRLPRTRTLHSQRRRKK
jgi:hypothetical protein